jgi:indole-3-glycerol phosphate synthase
MGILQRIVEVKRAEIAERQRQTPLSVLRQRLADAPFVRPFAQALKRRS